METEKAVESADIKELFSRIRPDSPIPQPILDRAHSLCGHYLGGAWKEDGQGEFTVKHITGGMSNLLFLVEVKRGTEHHRALLRIYGQADLDQLLCDSVVFTLLSERNLGPRLLGVFPGGRFEEFIPSRPLQCEEISKHGFITSIAPMVARVHSLDVPIGKQPLLLTRMKSWLAKWSEYEAAKKGVEMKCTRAQVSDPTHPSHLSLEDISAEVEFVEKFLDAIRSPIIFSHNDLQEGNILLVESEESAGDAPNLSLIDFEYCDYNYRGFDLGNHMCEYGLDYVCADPPYYHIHNHKLGMEEERRRFCTGYLEELYKLSSSGLRLPCGLITGDREADLAQLEIEATLFMPISHLFWSTWSLLNAEQSSIQFGYAEYARDRLALYFDGKKRMEEFMKTRQ